MRHLAIALLISITIAGCSHDNNVASQASTPLDQILVIGKKTRGKWLIFMKNGGLQTSDQWHGYTVQDVSLGFDEHDELSEISLQLTTGLDKQVPSFDNIKQNLSGICGQNWKRGNPSTSQNGNIICIYSPAKRTGYYHLEVSKVEQMN